MSQYSQKRIKAVIPAAGLGTRMLPATKAMPKEMLPLVDKPLIQYIVNECVSSGINDIVLVTNTSKFSIANHFDSDLQLITTLEQQIQKKLIEEIYSICPKYINIIQVRQKLTKGLGDALSCAWPVIGYNPVVVILPDVILSQHESDLSKDNLANMIEVFNKTGYSQIMVERMTDVTSYGVVDCGGTKLNPGDRTFIVDIIEKPEEDKAPSNLIVVGRYVLSKEIWPLLSKTPIGSNNEIQLTDTLAMLIEKEKIEAYHLKGKSYDCGNKLGYMKAFVEFGINHQTLGNDFRAWLKKTIEIIN
ncbi:UTP--glucose-1-phosphate uridylyltransferase GalU [Candidatus Erwinia haradaeae]|uniref:UTP--glucose-1-phosphate uridylyltransferase n=1 Tax=Candidatus Erwinia haradaeae TaxID=1922217 RepID=A0A451D811_9GAMM|nr:UTP--glucose-1-phosphate uridylyltransferase GalU [Candidatus Erwinia haradaeae]VFP81844.1 UTP--glucose-1-phosphate uridylyltransferase [Candidatus Erwinia haradaeae]